MIGARSGPWRVVAGLRWASVGSLGQWTQQRRYCSRSCIADPVADKVADKVAGTVVITVASPWNLGLYTRLSVALRKSRWQSSMNSMVL
jgi:hypothetical protein